MTPRPVLALAGLLWVVASLGSAQERSRAAEIPTPAPDGSLTPFLSASRDALFVSWLEPMGKGYALRLARWDGVRFAPPVNVHLSERFFVNWADFPSVVPFGEGKLVAHWLEKAGEGPYDYAVRIAISEDGGASFGAPVTLHRDGTLGEHGFVSLVPWGREGFAALWLDGRQMAADPKDGAMAVAATIFDGAAYGEEWLVDRRACECCQTAMAATAKGLLAVYRDRSEDEVRDMAIVRFDGVWTEPKTLHRDGWRIEGCPVNGPQVASARDHLAVVWFTAAQDDPRVQAVFSKDGGRSFSDPVRLDAESPVGRVDVELVGGGALVVWIEHVEGGTGEVRVQRVTPRGIAGPSRAIARTGSGRASGFPRTASFDGAVYVGWTESYERGGPSRVKLARVTTEEHE